MAGLIGRQAGCGGVSPGPWLCFPAAQSSLPELVVGHGIQVRAVEAARTSVLPRTWAHLGEAAAAARQVARAFCSLRVSAAQPHFLSPRREEVPQACE